MSHTPGPWMDTEGMPGGWPSRRVCKGDYVIAEVIDARCEANARLIAAAPELLEACREAVKLIGRFDSDLIGLTAAIAKAEGRS